MEHAEKIQEILDCYVSISPTKHNKTDIEVFYDDKSQNFKWNCPCNRSRSEAYVWQGVSKMEIHTSGKHHTAFLKKGRPKTNITTKPVTHIDFVNAREIVFDPVVFWIEEHKLPIEMLKIVPNTGGKRATCMYCGYNLDVDRRTLERHLELDRHKAEVKAFHSKKMIQEQQKLLDEFKREKELKELAQKTKTTIVVKTEVKETHSKKRERSPAPPLVHPEKEQELVPMPEEKRRKCIRDDCIDEIKKIDWKALIAEEARNLVKDMFEKDASIE